MSRCGLEGSNFFSSSSFCSESHHHPDPQTLPHPRCQPQVKMTTDIEAEAPHNTFDVSCSFQNQYPPGSCPGSSTPNIARTTSASYSDPESRFYPRACLRAAREAHRSN